MRSRSGPISFTEGAPILSAFTSVVGSITKIHSLPSAHTFTSVIGSLNVRDYFRFNIIPKYFFSLNNLRKFFSVLVLRTTYLSYTYIVYVVYVYLQIIWQAHYSHKNSALALIHYMEIPAIMWVSSGANLSST